MTDIIEEKKRFEFNQCFTQFRFEIGYDYSKFSSKPNLIFLSIAFWYIDFAW